jgi:hypothetical protein
MYTRNNSGPNTVPCGPPESPSSFADSHPSTSFWSYIKSKRQEPAGISPLLNKDGFLHSDSQIKAEILNNHWKTLQWITTFLSSRTQQVLVEGCESVKLDVLSGVLQGTVLGPLLFLVYINDLPEVVSTSFVSM